MLREGEVLSARYRLAEKIGEGGMGTVWLAFDEQQRTDVAVKVLHKTLIGDTSAVARFRNEARAAALLHHPNICGVRDVGEHDGAPFMVMERLRGENLAEKITRERSIVPMAAADILLDVLSALEAAHAEKILHRDLKPENIYLAIDEGRVVPKILDFGVAKFIGPDAERVKMTRTGALVGTPAYMSPEQAMGSEEIDGRSDVWATGVLLYEMLVGKLPFQAPNYNAMLVKIVTDSPIPIEKALPSIDADLAALVARAMARDRDERFASAAAFRAALRAWSEGAPMRFGPQRMALPTPHTVTTPMSWAETSTPPDDPNAAGRYEPSHRTWLLPVVLVAVLGTAGTTMYRGTHREPPPSIENAIAVAVAHAPPPTRTAYQLQIATLPTGASVVVNGAVRALPVTLTDGESAHLVVTAPGYVPWEETVMPTGDVTLTYEGRRVPPPQPVVVAVADAGVVASATSSDHSHAHASHAHTRGTHRPLQGGAAPNADF